MKTTTSNKNRIKTKNKRQKTKNLFNAAKSIMTTDTFPKLAQETVSIRRKKIKIYGIAKGSGMIAPNMGTMLSYIFIDASLKKNILNHLLKENIENSFNSISVDGDMSTNDTVVLFSTGKNILKKINKGDKVYKTFIHRNVKLGESPSFGKPIVLYDASSTGSQNYMNLVSEILNHNG